ncbi:MAG: CarD family transcriptional regulator [Clostridia bacterium]|nr:CarD family transcriptional regulator [Clostridia bacterium]
MSDAAKIGTYVLYGKTGVCFVKEQAVMSGARYYVLQPVSDSRSSVYVPCDNTDLVARMRPLLSREEIDRLLSDADDVKMEWVDDRSERSMLYRTITVGGDRRELIRLICCLMRKKQERIALGKRLSSMDESTLHECMRLVEEEFSMVLDIPHREVGLYIQERL